ncbi:three-Cys-motif partner protein TcmP [Halobacteria archaeon AArc-m2/3/4]|uniref:Three-Cys-motif partner protein TcmP n=1 Tax=Natronoglomus mannanivorans TaxID=2979990 RepID=A0ABT2QM49_9EURY|nr:three-Cys-motif partner protein TcmP [Halobacteria archaeon AArc-m2/3/4]
MDSSEYIRKRIQSLTENSEEIRDLSPVTNDFDSWSALKLILHSAAVNMYTNVLQSNDYFNDLYYIDALAGSGVSTYDHSQNSCFLGSPIIAAKVAQKPFKKMFLIEYDDEKADALEQRMEYVFSTNEDVEEPDDWEVMRGDANDKIPEVVSEIWSESSGGFNYYCFVDNQELNVKWDAIDELTPEPWGDLLINLPTASAIGRNATMDPVPEGLNDFYCVDLNDQDLPDNNIRPVMKELYQTCLTQNGRPIQRTTNVDANVGSYEYDLVYATRETDGENGYVRVIDYVKEFIEDVHAGDVDNILDVLYEDQSSFEQYLPQDNIDEEIPDMNDDVDENQTSLADF